MEAVIPFLIFGGITALIIFVVVFAIIADRKRKAALRELAASMNFEFIEKASPPAVCSQFKLFDRGRSRRCSSLMVGEAQGMKVTIMDYRYTTGSGKNSHTHSQVVCLIEDQSLNLPKFFMRHEVGLFDWIGEKFGGQDYDFEEDPAFSKAYVLQGTDEGGVRGLFGAQLRSYLVQNKKSLATLEAGGKILMINKGRLVKPDAVMEFMEMAFTIRNTLGS